MNDSNQGAQEHVIRAVQAGGNEKLLGAKEALKDRLMRAVLEQAIHEMGEPESIASAVMANLPADNATVAATSSSLQRLLIAEIERRAVAQLGDPEATANEIFGRVRSEWSEPDAIKDALRRQILADTANRAVESLGSTEDAAGELLRDGAVADDTISNIAAAVRNRVIARATEQALNKLEDRDAVAASIYKSLGEDHALVAETALALEVMIRDSVRKQAEAALGNASGLATQVYESLDNAEEKVREVARTVADRIVREIADGVTTTIANTDQLVADADAMVDNRDAATSAAISDLTNAIVAQVADTTKSSLADSEGFARRVMDRIEGDQGTLSRLTSAAKERVLSDMVNSAISELSSDLGAPVTASPTAQVAPSDSETSPQPQPQAPTPVQEPETIGVSDTPDWTSVESVADSAGDETATQEDSDGVGFDGPGWSGSDDSDFGSGGVPSIERQAAERVDRTSHQPADPSPSRFGNIGFSQSHGSESGSSGAPDASHGGTPQMTTDAPGTSGFVVEEVSFDQSDDVFNAFRDDDGGDVATQTATETKTAVYVYGVANGSAANHTWPDSGMDETFPVRTIGLNGLHAVVSNVASDEYTGPSGEANMKQVDWLKDRARRHAIILESLNLGDTFVPMRFCTVMQSDAAVEEMLSREFDHYRSVIDRVKGAEEWSVRIYRDLETLEQRVSDSDRQVEDSLGVISQGVVNFVKEEMQRIDKMGGEAVELITDHCVRRSHAALLECARDGLLKPVIADETGGDIILSAAYLVDANDAECVRDEVDRLASEYEELGFRFELSGPWPPYHFVTGSINSDDSGSGQ